MPGKADAQGGPGGSQQRGHQAEMMIVNPDVRRLGPDFLEHRLGEALVDAPVGAPGLGIKLYLAQELVCERPQGSAREAVVIERGLALAERDATQNVPRLTVRRHVNSLRQRLAFPWQLALHPGPRN